MPARDHDADDDDEQRRRSRTRHRPRALRDGRSRLASRPSTASLRDTPDRLLPPCRRRARASPWRGCGRRARRCSVSVAAATASCACTTSMLPATPAAKRSRPASSSWLASVTRASARPRAAAPRRADRATPSRTSKSTRPLRSSSSAWRRCSSASASSSRPSRAAAVEDRHAARSPATRVGGVRVRQRLADRAVVGVDGDASGSSSPTAAARVGLGGREALAAPPVVRARFVGALERVFERDVRERRIRTSSVSVIACPTGRPIARASCSFDFSKSLSATIERCRCVLHLHLRAQDVDARDQPGMLQIGAPAGRAPARSPCCACATSMRLAAVTVSQIQIDRHEHDQVARGPDAAGLGALDQRRGPRRR